MKNVMVNHQNRSRKRGWGPVDEPVLIQLVDGLQILLVNKDRQTDRQTDRHTHTHTHWIEASFKMAHWCTTHKMLIFPILKKKKKKVNLNLTFLLEFVFSPMEWLSPPLCISVLTSHDKSEEKSAGRLAMRANSQRMNSSPVQILKT